MALSGFGMIKLCVGKMKNLYREIGTEFCFVDCILTVRESIKGSEKSDDIVSICFQMPPCNNNNNGKQNPFTLYFLGLVY
jgi:hypothetical protein